MFLKNRQVVSGNADGLDPGSRINGAVKSMARVKVGTLSAEITVKAETPSLTFAVVWRASANADMSSPIDLAFNEVNGAPTVVATGTSDADDAVTKAFPAPQAAYSYRYVQAQLLTGGATGTTSDTYSIGYSSRQ